MTECPHCMPAAGQEIPLRDGRTVCIRPVRPTDGPLFYGYFDGLSAQSRDFMHGWTNINGPEHAEPTAQKAATDDHCALMVVTNETPEQMIAYCWIDGLKNMEIPMLGIGIIDAYHEAGLGKVLMRRTLAYARELGVPRVQLGVFADNARAMHVYEKVGFRAEPSLPPKVFDGRTEIYMVVETAKI